MGPDQPGILASICDVVAGLGCSMGDARVTRLAGTICGILVIVAPADLDPALLADSLRTLTERGIHIDVRELDPSRRISPHTLGKQAFLVSSSGADRPGILQALTHSLSALGCEFVDVTISLVYGAAGDEFILTCEVDAPEGVGRVEIQAATDEVAARYGTRFAVASADPLDDIN